MFVVLILMKTLFCEETLSNTQQNLIWKLQFIIGVHSKEKLVWFSFFDIRTESENRILTFKILFWHSLWVEKFYSDIQKSILIFALSRKILFWHASKSDFVFLTESENPILTFKILYWHSKFLFWHSLWVGKSYFDIQNSTLTFEMSPKILYWNSKYYYCFESENPILTFKVLFWHWLWVGKSYLGIQNSTLTFALSPKILFWHSIFRFAPIFRFALSRKILFWHSLCVGKSYFDI